MTVRTGYNTRSTIASPKDKIIKIFHHTLVLLPTLVLLFGCTSDIESVDKQSQPTDQGETVASIVKDYQEAYDEYRSASAAAKSAQEKQKQKRSSMEDCTVNMMAAVELDAESQAAFDGLFWLHEKTRRKDPETADKYLVIIMSYQSEKNGIGCTTLRCLR